ncbi:hypothetical protein NEMBOFW57_003516 [Staphylotrichum longicolle]|uniref:Ankyrin repeat protein n=1 Tax=Staphylotrichum longicolle TaxID=669026 RepID=A0AAD4F6C8_9PEZI|nr:hypothetical protein NEMBOFW57_003516 [Staphylotrichum longicolle]
MYFGASGSASSAGGLPFMSFEHQFAGPSHGTFEFSGQLPTAGKTQLFQAIVAKNVESVKALLFAGVAVSVKDQLGNEPLHSAVYTGLADIVELLLKFGANPNAKGLLDRSPLHLAVSNPKIVDALLKGGADPSDQDGNGDTPLHLALSELPTRPAGKPPPVVDALVGAGCDVNRPNEAGVSPFLKLLAAPHEGNGLYQLVIFFLEHGGSVHQGLRDGRTPLQLFLARAGDMWATGSWEGDGANRAFHLFLEKGVAIETATASSRGPLALSLFRVHRPDIKLATMLCERLDPNQDLGRGETLLHKILGSYGWGKVKEVEALVKVLLRRGADASHQNLDGQTPLAVLFETRRDPRVAESIVQMLLDKNARVSQRVIVKAARRFPQNGRILRRLLQSYARQLGSLHETSESHSTPAEQQWWDEWVHAARVGEWASIEQLLSQSHMRRYPNKAGPKFALIALAALVETYIWTVKSVCETPIEKVSQRECVAEALRLCRSQELPVDMACFDYLIELCL